MDGQAKHSYEFGPFCLDSRARLLLREGKHVALPPKALETLLVLIQNRGRVLEKDELMKKVWPDSFVEEGSLVQNIFTLRKALGDDQHGGRYIETVPRRGYCFVSEVRELREEGADLTVEEHALTSVIIEGEQEHFDTERLASRPAISIPPERPQTARHSSTAFLTPRAQKQFGSGKPVRFIVVGLVAILVVGTAIFGWYKTVISKVPKTEPVARFRAITMTRLTSTGKSVDAAVSPDGKYVAHVVDDRGQQSLWIRYAAVASDAQIVQPAATRYFALTFSRDGNWIYYVRDYNLYRIPTLGGTPRQLLANVDRSLTLSPDGAQLAFTREDAGHGESALVIADSDGASERRLAVRKLPDYFGAPAWSPDGKVIACSAGTRSGDRQMTVVEVATDTGVERPITTHTWFRARGIAWLTDGSGLLMTGAHQPQAPYQIWHISYPGGEVRTITNDLNDYRGVSISADATSLVTVQNQRLTSIWTLPVGDQNQAKQITSGGSLDYCLSWMPDGKMVYHSRASGKLEIWRMRPDGSDKKQLTVDAGINHSPEASPDGRYIVFASTRTGSQCIWRMDIDGSNPKQLTIGYGDNFPSCSPDGKWVVYTSNSSGKATLWKVPIDGGPNTQMIDKLSRFPDVSPNGKLIACYYWDQRPDSPSQIAIIPFTGGQPTKILDLRLTSVSSQGVVRWTPDGRAVTYIDNRNGISNIWSQPVAGGPPKQVTDFRSDQMTWFDWSPDGKQLACSRGVVTDDVVLITNAN